MVTTSPLDLTTTVITSDIKGGLLVNGIFTTTKTKSQNIRSQVRLSIPFTPQPESLALSTEPRSRSRVSASRPSSRVIERSGRKTSPRCRSEVTCASSIFRILRGNTTWLTSEPNSLSVRSELLRGSVQSSFPSLPLVALSITSKPRVTTSALSIRATVTVPTPLVGRRSPIAVKPHDRTSSLFG